MSPALRCGVGLRAGRDVACHACTSFATLTAGFPLLSLTQIHAYIYATCIKRSVFYPLTFGGGWVGKPENPQQKTLHFFCVRHAKGMRQHGAQHRSDSVARSTPTAPRSKQERPKIKLL